MALMSRTKCSDLLPPILRDGGQDDVVVCLEIGGCKFKGPPILRDGGQDDLSVSLSFWWREIEPCGNIDWTLDPTKSLQPVDLICAPSHEQQQTLTAHALGEQHEPVEVAVGVELIHLGWKLLDAFALLGGDSRPLALISGFVSSLWLGETTRRG